LITYEGGEMVRVDSSPSCMYPVEFTWRGRRYRVMSIEAYRTDNQQCCGGVAHRRIFRLRTASGMRCLLSQDVARETWYVEKILIGSGGEW
jgi:hypothetical protein